MKLNGNKEINNRCNSKQTGITLIALVVTIVVLLILAGVSISLVLGNSGIIKKAQEVQNKAGKGTQGDLEGINSIANWLDKNVEEVEYTKYWDGEVNKPNIKKGMIPVKWNGTEWVKADVTNTGHDWYNYSENEKKWANVVTVKAEGTKTREYYENAEVNTVINMNDITTMFVWIPRYAYKITTGYHENANGTGNIEIEWLRGKTNKTATGGSTVEYNETTTENYTKFPDGYVVHPAFASNTEMGGTGEELTGFWVGKFESSNYQMAEEYKNNEGLTNSSSINLLYGRGDGENVTIKPNVTSWRNINVTDIYNVCKNMTKANNIHGLGTDTTTAMMQNSQWGAVSYLSQSKYGNKQTTEQDSGIWNNPYTEGFTFSTNNNEYGMWNYSTTLTGMVGTSRDMYTNYYSKLLYKDGENYTTTENSNSSKTINEDGSITIKYISIDTNKKETDEYERTFYHYDSANGVKGSTTGTIYGIYDMSGGAWEYMASYLKDVQKTDTGYKYDYVNIMNNLKDNKYTTGYLGTEDIDKRIENYKANKHMYGDAVWETSNGASGQYSWNRDYSNFPHFTYPFFIRGGFFCHGTDAGVFFFSYAYGETDNSCGFRLVAL